MTRAEETLLLYALLDAAENEDRLRNLPVEVKWQDLKQRFDPKNSESEYDTLAALFAELERTDALAGTWIQFRWNRAKSQSTSTVSTRRKPRKQEGLRPRNP